jgi:phage repressor protein C with HTH and peptisase S24 domain
MPSDGTEVPRPTGREERQSWIDFIDPELLAELLGRELARDPDHPIWGDDRFLRWFAANAREEYERTHRMSDEEFRRRGSEFMARVQARKLRVARDTAVHVRQSVSNAEHERPRPVRVGPVPIVELGIAAGVGRELWDEPVSSWVELPPDFPEGQYIALKIVGNSMAPLMHTGDTVLVRVGNEVQRDTVIVARHPEDGYVCKRVSRLRRNVIELSSLESGRPLIYVPREPQCIVGTVVLVWCHHRQ